MSKLTTPALAFGLVLSLFSCQKEEVNVNPAKATRTTEITNTDIRAILKEQGIKLKEDAYAKAEKPPVKVAYGKWTGDDPIATNKTRCLSADHLCYFYADNMLVDDDGGLVKNYADDDLIVLVGEEYNFSFYGKFVRTDIGLGYTDYFLRQ